MKIALYNLTTTTKHGGVESFVWEVGRRLVARGHAVTIFGGQGDVLRPNTGITVRQYPYIPRERWGRSRVLRRSLNLLKLLERASMARHALADLTRGRFDVIQISKPYDLPWSAHARQWSGARVVYNAQGTDFWPGDKLFARTVDATHSCSRYNADMVQARYGFPISISYNGFDDALFTPGAPDAALCAELNPDGAPLVFYVGRLVTFKGLDVLLDAIARLPTPRLILAGEGPHRAALEEQARALNITDRVRFLGPIANRELPRYHRASDLFVLPSTDHETFGIAAAEAMACARPVVAARTGGLPEVVADRTTGLLVPPHDAAALAHAIGRLLADTTLRDAMGQAGRKRVLQEFTWDRVTDRVLASFVDAA